MVLLLPFLALSGLGFGLFTMGHFLEFTGVAAVGAVLIIALGGGVALSDLEHKTGEVVTKTYTNSNGSEVVDTVERTNRYDTIRPIRRFGASGQLGLGAMQMLVGGLLFSRRLNQERK
jgi:hypothetical protein